MIKIKRELLKQGDKVVIHTCLESERYNGKIWTCKTDEFIRGEGVYKQNLIFLEGFSGSFSTDYLQKVNIPINNNEEILINALKYIKEQYEVDFTKMELERLEPRDESIYSTAVETLDKLTILSKKILK